MQLVNAADGYQLWSERYDREMTDVFAVQDEIANAIATRLRGRDARRRRSEPGPRRTKNLEAYELLLRGRALQTKRGRFLPQAIACFEQAIALDPDYAEALAWLSDSLPADGHVRRRSVRGGHAEGEAAGRARARDRPGAGRGLGDAGGRRGAVRAQLRALRLAVRTRASIDPRHSRARAQRALWRVLRGAMTDEAVAEVRRAVQDDPLNSWVGGMHSYMLGIAGRHEESIVEAERSMGLDPDSFFAHWNVMRAYAWPASTTARSRRPRPSWWTPAAHPWALGLLAWTWTRRVPRTAPGACYDEMEGRSRHEFVSPAWLSSAAASAGLQEEAIRWIGRAVTERDPLVLWSRRLPFWDPIRMDPRFVEIMKTVWG